MNDRPPYVLAADVTAFFSDSGPLHYVCYRKAIGIDATMIEEMPHTTNV